jgi:hypothetical protein
VLDPNWCHRGAIKAPEDKSIKEIQEENAKWLKEREEYLKQQDEIHPFEEQVKRDAEIRAFVEYKREKAAVQEAGLSPTVIEIPSACLIADELRSNAACHVVEAVELGSKLSDATGRHDAKRSRRATRRHLISYNQVGPWVKIDAL